MGFIRLIYFVIAFAYTSTLLAAPETYIRSYRYQASETDSKLTARTAAISQVHHLLLGELGTYINSRIDITKTSSGKGFSQHDISTLTAGIIKTEILDESWDGNEYFVQAKLIADPDEIAKKLSDSRFIDEQQKNAKKRADYEMEYWKSISMSESPEMFMAYLESHPDGQFKELALLNIKRINDASAKIKLETERRETESRLLIQALTTMSGQASPAQKSVLLENPGKIVIVARHDTSFGSKKSREETTYLLSDILKKQVNKITPRGTEVIRLTDFDQTEDFLYKDLASKASKNFCAEYNSNFVIAAALEDHEGSKGYLRTMKLSLFNCDLGEMKSHTFLPEYDKGGRFIREASIKKELRIFVHDYIDSL